MKCKKNQNALTYGYNCVSRRCESYMMYPKGDGPHQIVMIVCESSWFSHIIIFIWWDTYAFLQKFHSQYKLFAALDTIIQVQCDLAI